MKRIHFIEIGDQPWCPRGIRRGVTDFCRFVTEHSGLYNCVARLLAVAVRKTGATRILDMGSGAADPWLRLLPALRKQGLDVPVCLGVTSQSFKLPFSGDAVLYLVDTRGRR